MKNIEKNEIGYYTISIPEKDIKLILDLMKKNGIEGFRIGNIPRDNKSLSYLELTLDTVEKVSSLLELGLNTINITPINSFGKVQDFELV